MGQNRQVELLAPAGSYESMTAAFAAGADAVYIGGARFGARAYADNLDEDALKRAIACAHEKNKKLYLTVNTLLKDGELCDLYAFLNPLYREGLDAVIVQDLGVFRYVRDVFPQMHIHASTQMGVSGPYGAQFLKEQGASRIVTARELSLSEIRAIHAQTDIEIESFVHGALCFCYSGQCLFSSMIGGRSGNRGRCAQPCRLPYELLRDGQALKTQGRYLLSPKDLCALELLPELVESGIHSLKIEGRMKRAQYTAGVTAVYRRLLDCYFADGKEGFQVSPEDKTELLDLYNRGGFSTGYYHQHNGAKMMAQTRPNHYGVPAAKVLAQKDGGIQVQALETLHTGDVLEYREDCDANPREKRPGENAGEKTAQTVLKRDVPKNQAVKIAFPGAGKLQKNAILYRTHNEFLLQRLQKMYAGNEHTEKINGKLILSRQKSAILDIDFGIYKTRAHGQQPQEALSRPLSEAEIEKQLRKTGGTGFSFGRLEIDAQPGLFLPMQALNELRRTAIAQLKEEIARAWQRPDGTYRQPERACTEPDEKYRMRFSVSLENAACLSRLCEIPEITDVYLDCNSFADRASFLKESEERIAQCHAAGKRCWYILPWIFQKAAADFYDADALAVLSAYDGVLLRNAEGYSFLKAHGYRGEMAADWNFYTFNREAEHFWREAGVSFFTASAELNRRELKERGCENSELILYGYQPLMVSAQCQMKNAFGCQKKQETLFLRDRMKKQFAVKNFCTFCYNTVYNSAPLALIGNAGDVAKLRPLRLRLQFTTEEEGEICRIARMYADVFAKGQKAEPQTADFTRGHFERGVE